MNHTFTSVEWNETPPGCEGLPCSGCNRPIGQRPWALAWALDIPAGRSMRLCNDCGHQAEQQLITKGKPDA